MNQVWNECTPKGSDIIIGFRELKTKENVECPKHHKTWIGSVGCFVVKLPGDKGAKYVMEADVFHKTYDVKDSNVSN